MIDFLFQTLPEIMQNVFKSEDEVELSVIVVVVIITLLLIIGLYILFVYLILKLNKKIFKSIEKKKGRTITLQFLQKAISLAIIVFVVVLPMGGKRLAQSLLGSTAVVAAVVGLAANDVIKNMFAGLEISIYKPFDVGSRIMLDNGTVGIVEKLTLRHVVLRLIDTTRVIIPNSKANSATIVNYSYEDNVPRSMDVRFQISYDADIEKARQIIRKTICDCKLTLNEYKYDEKDPKSETVYFLNINESSLEIGATVYYSFDFRTELVKNEVNTKVFNALKENNIEIPYNYVNILVKEGEQS
ncbi:MAG: mechanosensitive ion channel family protein [Butyrivibrio sp.]|nr:mechanosensitive ion channel family protein [Butyrivibrio sp.]